MITWAYCFSYKTLFTLVSIIHSSEGKVVRRKLLCVWIESSWLKLQQTAVNLAAMVGIIKYFGILFLASVFIFSGDKYVCIFLRQNIWIAYGGRKNTMAIWKFPWCGIFACVSLPSFYNKIRNCDFSLLRASYTVKLLYSKNGPFNAMWTDVINLREFTVIVTPSNLILFSWIFTLCAILLKLTAISVQFFQFFLTNTAFHTFFANFCLNSLFNI